MFCFREKNAANPHFQDFLAKSALNRVFFVVKKFFAFLQIYFS